MGLVTRKDVARALDVVEAGQSGVEEANLLRGYIAGLERGETRCIYCGAMVSQSDDAIRQHVEHDCKRHYARQLEERLAIYEDALV